MAKQRINSVQLLLSKTVDANGWTKYDYGAFQKYLKKGTYNISSIAGGTWTVVTLSPNLPVGMSNLGSNFITASGMTSDAAVIARPGVQTTGGTTIECAVGNQFSGTISGPNIFWNVEITTA